MNTKKILHLLLILSLFSIFSIIIANFTYKNLKQRVQTIYKLQPDFFTLKNNIPFNYTQELYTSVSRVRFEEFENEQTNSLISCDKISKINGFRAISVESEYDQFKIELIGQNIEANENCVKTILKVVTEKFHNNVRKKIDIIKLNKIYLLEILNRSNKPNINERDYNLVSASKIVNLIKIDQIKSAILGNNYLISHDKQDIKYLTFINGVVKKIIIENFISRQINFSIASPKDSVTGFFVGDQIEFQRNLVKDNLEIKKLENLLNNKPFKIYFVDNIFVKIKKTNYMFSIIILMNIIGLIIFIILNRNYFKKFLKKLS